MSLTIAYVTARENPHAEWFTGSLLNQSNGEQLNLIVVDRLVEGKQDIAFVNKAWEEKNNLFLRWVPPKPNVWQGKHRLTKQDWFAMANARNTALCLCETEWIAYVDDLSVLQVRWLERVKLAMKDGYNLAGAYRKVKNLVVENGEVKSWEPYSDDCRLALSIKEPCPCVCEGGWLYGCSCAFKVEDLLTVGGWPEYCDGLGAEDYCLGIALKNAGFSLMYDQWMMTYESEEDHWREPSLRKTDKGISPNDKSHAALNIAKASTYFPNYYPGGMRALREHVLAGNPFPVIQEPKHDWYDGQSVEEME